MRLRGGEGEIGSTHFGERTAGTQPGETQRWIHARQDDDAHIPSNVRDGVVDRGQAFPARHRLEVVEHDDQVAPQVRRRRS